MTADSGEIWCACRSTSTPSTPGILMSVTITSNSALSILRLANSPPVTVSTLCPSRRRAMSSSSQMERSSSQTRMLPTRPSSRNGSGGIGRGRTATCRYHLIEAAQPHHETRPFALVRLHDLVHDSEAESCPTFKIRLKRFEDLFRLRRVESWTGVAKTHLPLGAAFGKSHGQAPTFLFHRAHRVFAEIPENLLKLVSVGQHQGFRLREVALEFDARILSRKTVIK